MFISINASSTEHEPMSKVKASIFNEFQAAWSEYAEAASGKTAKPTYLYVAYIGLVAL